MPILHELWADPWTTTRGTVQDNFLERLMAMRAGECKVEDRIPHSASLQPCALLWLSVSGGMGFSVFQREGAKDQGPRVLCLVTCCVCQWKAYQYLFSLMMAYLVLILRCYDDSRTSQRTCKNLVGFSSPFPTLSHKLRQPQGVDCPTHGWVTVESIWLIVTNVGNRWESELRSHIDKKKDDGQ